MELRQPGYLYSKNTLQRGLSSCNRVLGLHHSVRTRSLARGPDGWISGYCDFST